MSFFNGKEPLGLPEGSVRALLALTIVIAAIVAVFVLEESRFAALLALVGGVTVYYFEQRRNGQ